MSAVLRDVPVFGQMREADLGEVVAIENAVYTHPWTRGNFADSLKAGYECRTLRVSGTLIGYLVLYVAAGESHLLNLSVASDLHRRGHGTALLKEALHLARAQGAHHVFLEVRPGNLAAQALYERFGFHRIAVRRGYYPAFEGREDALVYSLAL